MNQRILLVASALALCFPSSVVSHAEVTNPRGVVGNGGGNSSNSIHSSRGTLGQGCIGVVGGEGSIHRIGFWYTASPAAAEVAWPEQEHPKRFALGPGVPNPSREDISLRIAVPVRSAVSVRLYDVSGREVRILADGEIEAGQHSVRISSRGLASGIYFCRMAAPGFSRTQRLVLLR